VRFPCVRAAATTPVQQLGVLFAHSPSRISLPRKGYRVGLHIDLFEDCSAFTHVAARTLARSPNRDPLTRGFRHFVTSMPAPVASHWSDLAGWALHPLESAAFSRRTPEAVIRDHTVEPQRRDRLSPILHLRQQFAQFAEPRFIAPPARDRGGIDRLPRLPLARGHDRPLVALGHEAGIVPVETVKVISRLVTASRSAISCS